MKELFRQIVDVTASAPTADSMKTAITRLIPEFGFEYFAYFYIHSHSTYAISSYPIEWQKRYLDGNYAEVDPVVKMAHANREAFFWSQGSPRNAPSKEVRLFHSEASEFEIRSGVTIPVMTAFGHRAMLTFASKETTISADRLDQFEALSVVAQLHAKFTYFNAEPTARTSYQLTEKQTLCLKWAAEGRPMRMIASMLGISFGTVNFHLSNAKKVLDAQSLAQATAIATKHGLLD